MPYLFRHGDIRVCSGSDNGRGDHDRELTLQKLAPGDASTALRGIASIRHIEVAGENALRVTGTPAELELARLVIEMAENPSAVTDDLHARELSDESSILCVVLHNADVADVAAALRKEADVRRLSVNRTHSTVMVRDAHDRASSALALVQRMEQVQNNGFATSPARCR